MLDRRTSSRRKLDPFPGPRSGMGSGCVEVSSRRRARGLRTAEVRRDAEWLLHALAAGGELSVALVGDEEMRALNARYRRIDRPTDVLAFAIRESAGASKSLRGRTPGRGAALLGDVVISVDTAARQAQRRGVALADEVRTLLAHGVLHLLGYDHERSPAEARRMFAAQRRLVRGLAARDGRPPRAVSGRERNANR
jgi:rRNA maturation RNase YbeY